MQWPSQRIEYCDTGIFPKIMLDYIDQKESLMPLIQSFPSLENIRESIVQRKQTKTNRKALVSYLQDQYRNVPDSEKVSTAIQRLSEEKTYTITTAHQPNLLTGPLYFIYKIVHAISLADYCNQHIPDCHFVPVYYMGMEDADFSELNHFTVDGKKYQWATDQSGAFGKMKVDKALTDIIDQLEAQISPLPYADTLIRQIRVYYKEGKTIAQATFEWVHSLFSRYGLIVLLPDDKLIKAEFIFEMEDDLLNHSSFSILHSVQSSYPYPSDWQANPRAINLFYMKDDVRERIEKEGDRFKVVNTSLVFTKEELLNELHSNPQHFSPNVMLRPLLQEKILPNLVYIGGAGELSYWFQLKKTFEHYQISYPLLVLRNSFVLMSEKLNIQFQKAGFNTCDIFKTADQLIASYVLQHSGKDLSMDKEINQMELWFKEVELKASSTDATLKAHVGSLQRALLKKMKALEQKMLRAEKRRFQDMSRQIEKIRSAFFPSQQLQERQESMLGFYAKWGDIWIDQILQHSAALDPKMTILNYPLSY
jgi:bacillithiol biosynthesis cysteine-adding enzyme BshC